MPPFQILSFGLFLICPISAVLPDSNELANAFFDPAPVFAAYPNVRQARAGGLGPLAAALGGGTSSGFFGSVFSGITGALNKFSKAMGGPDMPGMPSGLSSAFSEMGRSASQASQAPPALGAWKPPRMSKPGPEVFRAMEARRKKVKGIHKRQISVKTLKAFENMNKGMLKPDGAFGGELFMILGVFAKIMSGVTGIGRSPVSRMKGHMDGFRDGAEALAAKVSSMPNEIFGAIRSRRQVPAVEDNEIHITVLELAEAKQKNWFTYLHSYNGTATECQELEFCRTAQENNAYTTSTARSGGKLLSYLVSGIRDARAKTGDRLSQAVDCCLSDDLVQAEACQNFYQQRCLQADLKYAPTKD